MLLQVQNKDTRTTSRLNNTQHYCSIIFIVDIFTCSIIFIDLHIFTCSKSTMETPKQCVKSQQWKHQNIAWKVNNGNTKAMREICSMLTVKTSRRRSSVFIANFEHISLSSSVFMGLQRRVKKNRFYCRNTQWEFVYCSCRAANWIANETSL